MTTERDKFLTEAMGICTHDWSKKEGFIQGHHCRKCDAYWPVKPNYPLDVIHFSTWPGFGKLWEWAIEQEWWDQEFGCTCPYQCECSPRFNIVNPDRFATAVYEYLTSNCLKSQEPTT